MEKQILKRGYVTNALTNENGEIYGLLKGQSINFAANTIEQKHTFYWSEVYCEPSFTAILIRKGTVLINPDWSDIQQKFEQSKINLNK